jgi:hypothetical protein
VALSTEGLAAHDPRLLSPRQRLFWRNADANIPRD